MGTAGRRVRLAGNRRSFEGRSKDQLATVDRTTRQPFDLHVEFRPQTRSCVRAKPSRAGPLTPSEDFFILNKLKHK